MATALAKMPPTKPLATTVVSSHRGGPEILDEFAAEWNALSDDAAEDQPFFRPDWIRAYFRIFESRARVMVVTARVREKLALVLPLVEEYATFSKVPIRRLRAPVNYCSSRFDGVRRTGPEGGAAIAATWEHLRDLGGWDLLLLRDALEGSTVSRLADSAKADGFRTVQTPDLPSPLISVPSDPDQLQKMPPNSKLRSQLKQIRLRITQHGALKFSCIRTADQNALERFYRLEASGWKGRTADGLAVLKKGVRPFYDEVAAFAARDGYFSLYLLELNDTLIAGHFSLTHRDRCYSPKVAYNEDYKALAPGHLIMAEILRDCAARGIREFDITGQDQPWKMKWTSETRPINHHFVFNGPIGALAYAVGSRLKSPVRNISHPGQQSRSMGA